jgi:glucose/arabinose dehydrogenase
MRERMHVVTVGAVVGVLLLGWVTVHAQRGRSGALGNGPWTYRTADAQFQVVVVSKGLVKPWSMAFLPDGSMLITELGGKLRLYRDGVLDPRPVAGGPVVHANRLTGLMDIALHPQFATNRLVYLSYTKPGPEVTPGAPLLSSLVQGIAQSGGTGKTATTAVWRARWDGTALVDGKDIFVFDNWMDDSVSQTEASRMVFGRDGMLYVGSGSPNAPAASGKLARARGGRAQDPGSHGGKFLRLKDDGTVPPDNPFVGRAGYKPEIYSMGHRNMIGLTVHPTTGAIWETENGPADGDEVNILKPGANYGWPLVGMGRDYSGDFIGGVGAIGPEAGRPDAKEMHMAGMEQPLLFWAPTVAPAGMTFYSGDRFPRWKGSLFVAVMKNQRLERIAINDNGTVGRREWLVDDLAQRFRDVRQGPDGLLYLLTDETGGALLRIEPMPAQAPN